MLLACLLLRFFTDLQAKQVQLTNIDAASAVERKLAETNASQLKASVELLSDEFTACSGDVSGWGLFP